MQSLADRVKIARKGVGHDVIPAIQFILNCGTDVAGSCHGGSHTGAFEFVKENGFIPFDDCLQYEACSAESDEGRCKGGDWSCSAMNTCRTCSTFKSMGGTCVGLDTFPNVTIAEYGEISGADNMMKEIYARGPIACAVDASPLHDYAGGIYRQDGQFQINHIISVTGWGYDKASNTKYWIMRNSWGSYWGINGYAFIEMGKNLLSIEEDCAWATPGSWTEVNYPCAEDGHNCVKTAQYVDPSAVPMWHMA
jgi:cathepsin X